MAVTIIKVSKTGEVIKNKNIGLPFIESEEYICKENTSSLSKDDIKFNIMIPFKPDKPILYPFGNEIVSENFQRDIVLKVNDAHLIKGQTVSTRPWKIKIELSPEWIYPVKISS